MSIVARFDPQSFFAEQPDFLTEWGWQSGWVYVKLKPGVDPASIERQLPAWEKRNIPDEDDGTSKRYNAGDNQDWYAQVSDLKLDYDREVGSGRDARVYFKGVPFLYMPVMSFSLNNQRKSGLLPATFGANSKVGVQYYQPFYWNIAPNMDATLTSRVMSKRGLQLNGEVRYRVVTQPSPHERLLSSRCVCGFACQPSARMIQCLLVPLKPD